jgi:antitoxin (DNA-binding transcriptional repressor) of toxin-antitoxin stability system
MKVVGVQETNLEQCLRHARRQRVVLTKKGKPIALLVGVEGLDLEQIELGHSDEFWKLIRARRRQRTITRKELDKRLTEK